MTRWRQRGDIWQLEPAGGPRGCIEFIGGSYLAATPQLSYRRLLEALASKGWLVRAWSYVPGFDHQDQANTAWRRFRQLREADDSTEPLLRLGHSLGCKLHLLAPDGGRTASGLVALSFNNFSAERSVPLLAELGQQFNFRSEFSPSPEETLHQVARSYRQPRNLLVRFNRDGIDQSGRLLGVLQSRTEDATELLELPGDHLAPASAGLRQNLLGSWADDPARQRALDRIATSIDAWGDQPSRTI
ncbi:MAG: DUF1350 domain-containing protein [Cyanobacteria bacterium M_DeepCast_100m_m1_067]|nr:DUF1350 domain-containing protein [Cyanobacteria bacterium M_DeepCast_100m_m1_067]